MPKKRGTINIPRSMIERIDKIIDSGKFDYLSREELVREACRTFLKELVKLKMLDYHEIS